MEALRMDSGLPVVANNETVIEPGGVYLSFQCDDDEPYSVAKVLHVGGNSAGYVQLSPGLTPVASPDLWLKLYRTHLAEPPAGLPAEVMAGPAVVMPVTLAVFLAWGPPKFPVWLGTESVTADELAAIAALRHLYP